MHFIGKVTFSLIGAYCEELINELSEKRIALDNIGNTDGIIYADTSASNYPYIARLSRKYGVRSRVVSKKGAYFRLLRLRKRPGLIAGIFVSSVMVLTLRLFVWHIEIHGNETLTNEYMLGLLEQNGFTAGVLANDTDALNAERRIMLSSDLIRWINIEVNGSRADVYMNENTASVKPEVDQKTPCNIVAERDGVIVDTNVTSGKLMYEKGSGVAKGCVIVSGTVSSGDSLILVHSDAEIIAEFTEEKEFGMAYTTVEKVMSDKVSEHRQLMLFGIVIPLDGGVSDTSNTICTQTTEQCRLFGFDIPAKIRTDTYRGYSEITVTRTSDDVRRALERELEMYIHNFLNKYEVIKVEKSFEETADGLSLKAVIHLKGNIAVKKPIYEH
jgi:Putative stage IV sporulation protein YqfD.